MAGSVWRAVRQLAGSVLAGGGRGSSSTTGSFSSSSIAAQQGAAGVFQAGARRLLSSGSVVRAAGSEGGASSPARSQNRGGVPKQELKKGGGDIKPDLVRLYLSSEQFSAYELGRLKLKQIREGFANHPQDCGGSEVQIAALTEKVRYMTGHLQEHHKDKASRRGLVAMLERRKKLLKYLRRTNGDSYGEVIYRLGLKDRSFVEPKYGAYEQSRSYKKALDAKNKKKSQKVKSKK